MSPLMYLLIQNIRDGHNIQDEFISYYTASQSMLCISVVLMNIPSLPKVKKAVNKLINFLRFPSEGENGCSIRDGFRDLTIEEASGDIEFRNVSFRYPNSNIWILKNFNLKINAGTCVGIIGPSGYGKTTIIELLLRFYQPQSGEILISGIPISSFTIWSLRIAIGWVQQEPVLFDTSIAENIAYGNQFCTEQEILIASQNANAHDFICDLYHEGYSEDDLNQMQNSKFSTLPEGYHVNVGHKGSKLSGGQKQRVAIARCLVRKPCIFLLDEATSALDEESQEKVQNAFKKCCRGVTSIIIAHTESTQKMCDKVIDISKI